ncbi:hypothetical protein WT60_02440 [Burkholderia sp. MSMB617WGS]|nr:hypothetical protein WT60_02440 [Burkholderia sp. MSMB617WGS]
MLLYRFREHIRLNWLIAIALVITYLLTHSSAIAQPLFYIAFVYVLLLTSVTKTLWRFAPRNDYSYGIYLWAFPVQQVIASRHPYLDNLISLLISVPVTLLLAMASWHLIERPILTLLRAKFKQETIRSRPEHLIAR